MTTSEKLREVIETSVNDLSNPNFFTDPRISSGQSTNQQSQHIADLARTNQFLLGEILMRLTIIQRDIKIIEIRTELMADEITSIKDHLKNHQNDESLAQKFKESFNNSDELKSLSKAIEDAKALNKEVIHPDFGWSRRGSGKWL